MTILDIGPRHGEDTLQETQRRLDIACGLGLESNGDGGGMQELVHSLVPSGPVWVDDYSQPHGPHVDDIFNVFNDDCNNLRTMTSSMPNRSASWPSISEHHTLRDMSIRPTAAERHAETGHDTFFSSRRVPPPTSCTQCVVCHNHAENPEGGMMKVQEFARGAHEVQSLDAISGSLDASQGQAMGQIDVTQASAFPTMSGAQPIVLHGAHQEEFPKQTMYHLESRTLADSKGRSPIVPCGLKRTAAQASHGEGFTKRKKSKSASVDDVDESLCDEELWNGQGEDSAEADTRSFACPFYRRFPIRHKDCINRKLSRIRDIKQHILRRHVRDDFYSPTCYKSYGSSNILNKHTRPKRCGPRSPPVLDGLDSSLNRNSKEVQDLQKYRANRTLSNEDQWHEIWDILFKDEPKARNAYLGTVIEETVRIIRGFWEQKGLRVTPAYLASKGIKVDNETDIRGLMMGLFDEVQRQFEQETRDTEPSGVQESEQSSMAHHDTGSFQHSPATASPETYSINVEPESYVHVEEAALAQDLDGSQNRLKLSPAESSELEGTTAFLGTAEQAHFLLDFFDWPSGDLEDPFNFGIFSVD